MYWKFCSHVWKRKRTEKITPIQGTGMNVSPLSKYLTRKCTNGTYRCFHVLQSFYEGWCKTTRTLVPYQMNQFVRVLSREMTCPHHP